jgi:hypothetical protein
MHPKTRALRVFVAVALVAGLFGPAASALADDAAQAPKAAAAKAEAVAPAKAAGPAEPGESAQDELSRRATDPTASPLNFGLINDVTTSYRDLEDGTPIDETGYQLKFQPVIPFKAWGIANILRMTVPYQISGPGPEGLKDLTIFDMAILPQSWGRLGIGVVGSFAAATSEVSAHATVGPAIGFVAQMSKKLSLGLFNQNLFGNDVAISQIQPILAYQLGSGWSLSLGDLQWPYDWDRGEFLSMPIGVQLGKVLPVAKQPMRFAVNPQYDLKDLPGGSRFKVLFTITLLLPEKRAK